MRDRKLLLELLEAEDEKAVLGTLERRALLLDPSRWRPLGNMRNNQSVVHAQQSSAAAALVEKVTNGIDALLLRRCKALGIGPRDDDAPQSMAEAVKSFFVDIDDGRSGVRRFAEDHLVLYATGSKARPSLSLYDAGEGQFAENFSSTFCSLVFGSSEGSYKGAIPFVQGRFNMGGSGVLPFCSEKRRLQLIVSRVPAEIGGTDHEWAFTLVCFFQSKQSPEWRYLTDSEGLVLTADRTPLGLVPKTGAASGEICAPRERLVESGTLIKMYDFKAPRSNVCGELFKKLQEYLLVPALPLRIIECRPEYKANVMGVTVWDRLAAWGKDKLEAGFESGASIQVKLSTGEIIPAEVRVFRATKGAGDEQDLPQTGLRALINGQSHAHRDAQFFRTKAVDKEHIAGSMLVTLDCTALGQDSRNDLFMSNREMFRDGVLLPELLRSVQKELKNHEGLIALNDRRYADKIANATSDNDGISALEDLLSADPSLAELFGSSIPGKVASRTLSANAGDQVVGPITPFVGKEFPTFFERKSGKTGVRMELQQGEDVRVSFLTDVVNNYFTRATLPGTCEFGGSLTPNFHLFNGRLTFTIHGGKDIEIGSQLATQIAISDEAGHGPFKLTVLLDVVAPKEKVPKEPPSPNPRVQDGPSRPDILEIDGEPEDPPTTVERANLTAPIKLTVNKGSRVLMEEKARRPREEAAAVEFVFKYGLALVVMGMIEAAKKTPEWATDDSACRKRIQESAGAVARVIVPICLALPSKLPKAA